MNLKSPIQNSFFTHDPIQTLARKCFFLRHSLPLQVDKIPSLSFHFRWIILIHQFEEGESVLKKGGMPSLPFSLFLFSPPLSLPPSLSRSPLSPSTHPASLLLSLSPRLHDGVHAEANHFRSFIFYKIS